MTFIAQAYKILCVIDLRSVMLVVPVVDVKHTRFAAYLAFEFCLVFDVSGNNFPVKSAKEVTIFHRLYKRFHRVAVYGGETTEILDHSYATFSEPGRRIQIDPYEPFCILLSDHFSH